MEVALRRAMGAKYISILDLKDGFQQVVLKEEYRKYFSFIVPEGKYRGQYQFNSITQDLSVSAALF